MIDQIYCDI